MYPKVVSVLCSNPLKKVVNGMHDVMNLKPIKESFKTVDLLDMEETMEILKVSKVTIHNWKKKGFIKSYKVGRKLYFKKAELVEAIQRQKYSI
ncbi:excisionase family DNA binding protein [Pedobacter sp. UYP30]|uniref:helix-turn-helix domain-containing protein n=1 Tax=Pedobacter sp. UYP30 TaxID=1756400 RepID=UPI00339A2D16